MNPTKVYDVILPGQMMKDRIILQNETITIYAGSYRRWGHDSR